MKTDSNQFAGQLASAVVLIALFFYFVFSAAKDQPKEMTPLDLANIMVEKVNKLNSQIRAAEKRIETLERLQAGELPQIHGGVSYGN